MGEEADAVLQHAQHLGPLDHSMQREALICKGKLLQYAVVSSGISIVCGRYVSVTGAPHLML
jgi:hypothetical protein